MNKEKQRNYLYYHKDELFKKAKPGPGVPLRELKKTGLKLREDAFLVSMDQMDGEYPTDMYEIVKRKKQFKETAPIQLSHFILSNAKEGFNLYLSCFPHTTKNLFKLHMLRFVDMIIDYWKTESLKLLYTGE